MGGCSDGRHWFDTLADRLYHGRNVILHSRELSGLSRYALHRLALAPGSTCRAS